MPPATRRAKRIPDPFAYPYRPIGSVDALARHLGCAHDDFRDFLIWVGPHRYREKCRVPSSVAGVPDKVIYDPHPDLKALQRRLNESLLSRASLPAYVVGGVKGRGVRHALERHTYGRSMMRFDVRRFFESTVVAHVRRVFRHVLRVPPDVEEALVVLTTINGHLPRGAPTSSSLANLVLFSEEPRTVAWLEGFEPFAFRYTRWVDDIVVTSKRPLTSTAIAAVRSRVAAMLRTRGLRLASEKTVVLRHASRYVIHGVKVCGARMSISKAERRRVRAGVQRLVAASQLRRLTAADLKRVERLLGKVAHMWQFHPDEMEPHRRVLQALGSDPSSVTT